MLQEQICDHNIINSKLRGLNIGEININHNEQLEVEEESIAAGCVPDQHVHCNEMEDVMSILNHSRQYSAGS